MKDPVKEIHENTAFDVFSEAERAAGDTAKERFPVRPRGRPKSKESEMRERIRRRESFGSKFRRMRVASGMTLAAAADAAGISSPRKLSQYETTCYPPGWVIREIAPVYGVSEKKLAAMVLKHSDPDMFRALAPEGNEKDEKTNA